MWTLLDHRGNSCAAQRIALMERYLALFGSSSIKLLMADREFIGCEWMEFLNENNIPFAIRIKAGMRFELDNGGAWSLKTLLGKKRIWTGRLADMTTSIDIAAKRLKGGEWLIVATNTGDPKRALNIYRKRWAIECLFADTKRRGLNLEDTRLTNPAKLDTLLATIALAIIWAYRCATQTMGRAAIKRKTHGRREKSQCGSFRVGLDALRRWIANQPTKAENAWMKTYPIRLKSI